jgi:hypothetical protein
MTPVRALALITIVSALSSVECLRQVYKRVSVNDSRSTEIITREIPWDGSASVSLGLPAVMHYVQASGPGKILARGPHRSVSTIKVTDGTIHDALVHTGALLEITLTAPAVSSFHLDGRSRLVIDAYDQDRLALHTEGGAGIDASGHARDVRIIMNGSGAINLARLTVEALESDITGASTLVAAPMARANLEVSGRASVILLTRPADLMTHLKEAGRVIDADLASKSAEGNLL